MQSNNEVLNRFSIPLPTEVLNQLRAFSSEFKDIDILISSIKNCISFDSLNSSLENPPQSNDLESDKPLDISSIETNNSESFNKNIQLDSVSMKTLDNYFFSNKKKVTSPTKEQCSHKNVLAESAQIDGFGPSKQPSQRDLSNVGTRSKDSDSDISHSSDVIPSSQDPFERCLPLSATCKSQRRSIQENFSTLSSFSKTLNNDSDESLDNSTHNSKLSKTYTGSDLNNSKNTIPNDVSDEGSFSDFDSSDVSDTGSTKRDMNSDNSKVEKVSVKKLSLGLKKSSPSTNKSEISNYSSNKTRELCPELKEQEEICIPSRIPPRKSILSFNPNNFDPELGIVSGDSNRNNISCTFANAGGKATSKTPPVDAPPNISSDDFTDSSDSEDNAEEVDQEKDTNESGVFLPNAASSFLQDNLPLSQKDPLERVRVPPRVSLLRKEIAPSQIRHSTPLSSPSEVASRKNNHEVSESEESENESEESENESEESDNESSDLQTVEQYTNDKVSCSSEFQVDTVQDEKWLKNVTTNKVKHFLDEGQETLYLEELSSDDEVYIVQCPNEVDIMSISKSKISLPGLSEINLKSAIGENLICEANCIEQLASKVSLLCPSYENPLWKIRSVTIRGSVLITEKCQMPMTPSETTTTVYDDRDFDSDNECVKTPLPKDIRIRHPIHGTDFKNTPSPKITKKKKNKVRSQETLIDDLTPSVEPPEFQIPLEKKKKKKKKEPEIDMEAESGPGESYIRGITINDTTISLLTDDEGRSRKKKKKKNTLVEEAPTPIESPEFITQKEKKKKKNKQQQMDFEEAVIKEEPVWDRVHISPKKKKKQKTKEMTIKEEIPWDGDQLPLRKTNKDQATDVTIKEELIWDRDQLCLHNKKKKKHKAKAGDMLATTESSEFNIHQEKKKKKKKDHNFGMDITPSESRGVAIDARTVSLVSEDEHFVKKKKVKTTDAEVAIKEEPVWDRVHMSPKKKKKHKTKVVEMEMVENAHKSTAVVTESVPKIKKRKHRNSDLDISFQEADNRKGIHSKKKKHKADRQK